jgi:hypothetical protein
LPTPPLPAKKIILTKNPQEIVEGSENLLSGFLFYHKIPFFGNVSGREEVSHRKLLKRVIRQKRWWN